MVQDRNLFPLDVAATLDGHLGVEFDPPAEDGSVTARMPVTDGTRQAMGIVHGGAYAALAETVASMGTARVVIEDGRICMGMSNNTSFLRATREGTIHARGTPLHRGATTWVWSVEMTDDQGRRCAVTTVTMAVRTPR